jgi:hypothetical protein
MIDTPNKTLIHQMIEYWFNDKLNGIGELENKDGSKIRTTTTKNKITIERIENGKKNS